MRHEILVVSIRSVMLRTETEVQKLSPPCATIAHLVASNLPEPVAYPEGTVAPRKTPGVEGLVHQRVQRISTETCLHARKCNKEERICSLQAQTERLFGHARAKPDPSATRRIKNRPRTSAHSPLFWTSFWLRWLGASWTA